jgi:hypothetical protein
VCKPLTKLSHFCYIALSKASSLPPIHLPRIDQSGENYQDLSIYSCKNKDVIATEDVNIEEDTVEDAVEDMDIGQNAYKEVYEK